MNQAEARARVWERLARLARSEAEVADLLEVPGVHGEADRRRLSKAFLEVAATIEARVARMKRGPWAIVGRRARLRREVTLRGGQVYAPGTLWRIASTYRGRFGLLGILESGEDEVSPNGTVARYIRDATRFDFSVVGEAAEEC